MNLGWIEKLHLVFVFIALITVVLSLVFSFLYLIQQWQLKHKKNVSLGFRLPSLESLDRYVIRCLVLGSISLSVLLVSGILLAHLVWKNDWIRDQKFIVAMVTWVWFVFTLFLRFKLGMRGEKFFYSILIGLVFLVISCFLARMV